MHQRIVLRPAFGDPLRDVVVRKEGKGGLHPFVLGEQCGDLRLGVLGRGLASMHAAGLAGIADPDAVGFPDVLGKGDRVRAEGGQQVEGGGEHRLHHLVLDGLGLVLLPAVGHLGDGGRGGTAPRNQVRAWLVGGEQFAVVDQVDGDQGGGSPGRGALAANHTAVLVEHIAPVGQVCLAARGVHLAEGGEALLVEPAEEAGEFGEPVRAGPQVQRGAVSTRQWCDRRMPGRQQSQYEFLGDQSLTWVRDQGEVEAPLAQ